MADQTIDWNKHIADQEQSGKSFAKYCREQGISLSSFYMAKRKLKRLGLTKKTESLVVKSPGFVEVDPKQLALKSSPRPVPSLVVKSALGTTWEFYL